jgi:heat shock protein HslJ
MKLITEILVIGALITMSCGQAKQVTVKSNTVSLFGTYWKLVELNGTEPGLTSREPHLVLNQSENKVNGNGGCNSFFGSFQHSENSIAFSNIGSTKMACPGLPVENEFFKTLQQVTKYRMKGDSLLLDDASAITVAKFVPGVAR